MVIRLMRKAVAALAASSLLMADLAWAGGPVADPAAPLGFRPTVQAAPNGVPTVNIVNPSAGGVSHNKYTGYDVDPQGVVLNNSMMAGTSALAGALAANPNLSLPAQVILNEVTGIGASQLNGPTEVFGPSASIIVANPNGISVDGASFINSPRVTLTTGTPTGGGSSLGFSVQGGQIGISGAGLDGGTTDQVDLVGRRVVVDGEVSGSAALNVVGGGSEYTYATGEATEAAAPVQAGSYSIDASLLGAMNAGQVRLIGTEAGVGVRALGGVAASAGDITVTSSGEITIGGATASRDVSLSGTNVGTSGTITAARNIGLAASQAVTTAGTHDAQGVTIAAGTTAQLGATTSATSLTASATGALAHTGATTLSGGNATLDGAGVTMSGSIVTDRDVSVTSTAAATLGGTTTARGLTAAAGGALSHTGTTNLSGTAALTGETVSTAGILSADGAVGISAIDDATLGGSVTSRTDLTIATGNGLTVNGTVAADGNATVTAASVAVNSAGALSAGGAVGVTASGAVTNDGVLDAGAALVLDAASLTNTGRASAAAALSVTTSGAVGNSGGQMAGDSIGIAAGGALDNATGSIAATNAVSVTAGSVNNRQGFLRSIDGTVAVSATGTVDNTQGAVGGTDIGVTASAVDNTAGEIIATTGDLGVTTTGGALVNKGGTLFANGTNTLTSAAGIDNSAQGSVGSLGQLSVGAQGTIDNTAGTMVTNDRVTVTTPGQIIQGGSLTSAGDLTASAGTFTNRGYTASASALAVSAGGIVNESGQMAANDGVVLTATGAVENRAQISSGLDVGVAAASLSNTATGRMEANRHLAAATTGAISNAGIMAANDGLSLSAGSNLTNANGTVLSGGAMVLEAASALTNQAGLIQSGGDMTLRAGTRIDNVRAPFTTVGTGNGGYRQQETSGPATLTAGGNMLLRAPVVLNQASLMSTAGDMTIDADTFLNQVNSLTTLTMIGYQVCKKKWYGSKKCWTEYSPSTSNTQTPSLVHAGGTLTANAATITNTGTVQAHKVDAVANVMTNGIVDWTIKTMPAAVPSARIDLTQYAALPESTPGLFDISRDPASRYVITTTVDVANLLDHEYLLDRLGPAAEPDPRFFADPFAEAEILKRAALAETGQRFFVPEVKTDEEQRKALYDNAIAFAATRTDVKLGVAFTDEQIAALDKPIIWYVDDGSGVLNPTIYLPQVSQRNLVHLEGGRIIADDADIQVAGQFTNTGFVNVANTLTIDAGSIVNEQRTARDTAARIAKSKGKTSLHTVELNVLQQGGEITAGTATLRADGDVTSSGGRIAVTGTLAIEAENDVAITAARVENHERVNAGKAGWEIDSTVHHAGQVSAGQELSIVAGRDVAVAGSKVEAEGNVTIAAGRDVTVTAVADELYSHSWSKKSRSKIDTTIDQTRNQSAEITSTGGNVDIWAGDNLAVQASRVAAAGDVGLEADQGVVALLSGTDTSFVHEKTERKGLVWQSSRDRGETSSTVVMTELEAGGTLSVAAGSGVVADYRASGGQEASLAALAQDPRTAWVAEIAKRDDVAWRAVNEAYDSWDHKTQGLSGPAAMVIAIAVTVATQGAGASLLGATGAVTAAMANAGFSALVAQASISLINNQGDLGKVLKELGSAQTIKTLAVAVATAGLTQGISEATGVDGTLSPQAPIADRVAHEALKQSIQAGANAAVNITINGGDISESLLHGLTQAAISTIGVVATQEIGNAYKQAILDGQVDPLEYALQKVAHAAVGCGTAAASGASCGAGAAGAATAAAVTEAFFDPSKKALELAALVREGDVTQPQAMQMMLQWQQQGADLARLAGGLAALAAGAQTGADVAAAANAGDTVARHNVLETALDLASLALSLNELRIVLQDKDASKLDILLATGSVVIDGAAVALPFIPGGAGIVLSASKQGGKVVVKATTEAGQDVTDALKLVDQVGGSKYWTTITEFGGSKVYQRNDLIDPLRTDKLGRTNLQRMEAGIAPIGPDGNSINLHHMLQTQDGPIAELTQTFHQSNTSVIHINPSSIPSGIDRAQFNKWRSEYWMSRAKDF
jgi:filamentous haemagglutinin family N-terminal domain